ncbi:hypothetical protein FNL37_1846 [Methylovorus glucosotrophus]|nr:hypothetical protein FNL37_1846 [Methylovorus glucosotrophus]
MTLTYKVWHDNCVRFFIVNSVRDLNFKFMHPEKPHIYNNLSMKDKVLLRS